MSSSPTAPRPAAPAPQGAPGAAMSRTAEIRLVAGRELRAQLLKKSTLISTGVMLVLVIGVIVAVAQAGLTGASLCQAVREGARAASIGQEDPQAAASAAYAPGSYAVSRADGWVSVTGTAPYRGAAGWVGGIARCSVTTIDEGDLP